MHTKIQYFLETSRRKYWNLPRPLLKPNPSTGTKNADTPFTKGHFKPFLEQTRAATLLNKAKRIMLRRSKQIAE